jgi:Domain of unknown function (DUF222)
MTSMGSGFDHPAVEAVGMLDAALDTLADAALWSLPVAQLGRLVAEVERVSRRLDAARVALVAQAEMAGVADHESATSVRAWLHAVADVPAGATKARLGLHRELVNRPHTAAAFRAGEISFDAAVAVCSALNALPAAIPAVLGAEVETLLVEVAKEEGTRAVGRRAAEIVHRFAPEELERIERTRRERNALVLTQRHDGSLGIRGQLDTEHAALALAVLGAHAKPLPRLDGTPDFRDAPARYADAFVRVLELASGAGPKVRGERPRLTVTIGLDALQAKLHCAPGLLPTGTVLSASTVRRLACDAQIIPLLLGGRGEPLDIGRATRVWPSAIRRALEARDRGCAMPGCDRPVSWCDIHHAERHWADGGATAASNGVLLCERHHTLVHEQQWRIRLEGGLPWFIPPPWIDSARTPRLHCRYKIRELDP